MLCKQTKTGAEAGCKFPSEQSIISKLLR